MGIDMLVIPRVLRKVAQGTGDLFRRVQRYFTNYINYRKKEPGRISAEVGAGVSGWRESQPPKKPVQSAGLFEAELAQLEKILASEMFIHARKSSLMLRYIVDRSLHNDEGGLK